MRFEQLEYLVTIAETQSFSAAAQKLFVTQQAISLSMKQLEQEIEHQLFIKENNKTVLTQAGEEMLIFAQKTLQEKNATLLKFKNLKKINNQVLNINIGSTSCVTHVVLPTVIADIQRNREKVYFKIQMQENVDTVLQKVSSGELDIGLVNMNADELHRKFTAYKDELSMELLANDKLVAVMNRKFYDGNEEMLTQDELQNYLRTTYNIETIDMYKSDIQKVCIAESNDTEFHRAMLDATKSVVNMSWLSYHHFFNNKKNLALPMEHYDITFSHAAVYRKDADATIQEIVRMIRKEMHVK